MPQKYQFLSNSFITITQSREITFSNIGRIAVFDVYFLLHNHQSKVWSPKIKNRKTAGELWLDFLNFYSEEFDFDWEVVCCRRKKRLTKFEKMWTKPVFAIEGKNSTIHSIMYYNGIYPKYFEQATDIYVNFQSCIPFKFPIRFSIPLERVKRPESWQYLLICKIFFHSPKKMSTWFKI